MKEARAHGLRDDPLRGREEEGRRRPAHDLERNQVPDLGGARQHERGDRRLRRACHRVRGHHHVVPREPVGPDPAYEDEDDLRNEAGRDDDPEVGRRPGEVEHRERERDRGERGAEERDRPADEEQDEVALRERGRGAASRDARAGPLGAHGWSRYSLKKSCSTGSTSTREKPASEA